jgi:hypothetical protein
MKGRKYDKNKPRWDLLPIEPIEEVVKVLSHGARKYYADNWKDVPNAETRYYSAAMRHLTAWKKGFKRDKETGRSHLSHAICCLIFLLWFEKRRSK